jgi:hypothetical protein
MTCVHDTWTAARDVIMDLTYKYVSSSLSKTCVRDAGTTARDAIPEPNISQVWLLIIV